MVHVQFLPSGSCGSVVLFSIRGLGIFVFWFKNFKLFPVKARFFRRPFIFCTFCFLSWGFETAPGRGNPASVIDHAMTSRDYIKVEQVRTWLLSSSLAVLKQIIFWMLFSSLLQLSFSWLHGSFSVFASRVLWFFCFVLHTRTGLFVFLVWKFQTVPR